MASRSRTSVDSPPRGDARAALLNAALMLVRRQGWSATSIDQLCKSVGLTKGAFFHHFASKDDLGIAAARHWDTVTAPLFANADYHRHADPLDRIFGYLDFRAAITEGPLEDFTCFVGTMVQETFATSAGIRAACDATIKAHAARVAVDFRAALEKYPPLAPVTAESLALYTQSVLQGGFVLSKAQGNRAPLLDALAHLKNHLTLLFRKPLKKEKTHGLHQSPRQLHLVRTDDPRRDRGREILRRGGGMEDRGPPRATARRKRLSPDRKK